MFENGDFPYYDIDCGPGKKWLKNEVLPCVRKYF